MSSIGIGVVGLGNIFDAYMKASASFDVLDIRAVADLDPAVAQRRAEEYGLRAVALDDVFEDPSVDIILNLTIPAAHVEVGLRAIAAGKHVYSEKPIGIDLADAGRLVAAAREAGLRVGVAPDTFLGGGHQVARGVVDSGRLGTIVGGTAYFMCPGHERWHPNPAFYYQVGGGPMLDMGPYYITDLVNLLGPVARVTGHVSMARKSRPISSEPRKGEMIEVEVPTHVTGLMQFEQGAAVQITMSFDVAAHRHLPLELHGIDGSLVIPDPNHFGGDVEFCEPGGSWETISPDMPYRDGNYRSIGLADMAHAILSDRPHRANGDLALHVLEVMQAFALSSEQGRGVEIESRPARPEALSASFVDGVLGR